MTAVDRRRFAGSKCVVTGGLGFIGSNLSLALAEAEADVTVVDAAVARHGANPENLLGSARPIVVLQADIGDQGAVTEAVAGAHYVFNLAGQVSHIDAMENPVFDLDMNVRSHLRFLETLRKVAPDSVVVHASTRLVYGRPQSLPVDETHPCNPHDVNGVTKLAGEQLHLVYRRMHGLRACSLRLCNIYGPRQRIDDDRQGVLPSFIRMALDDEPLTLFGKGLQVRDCLYVDDAVEAFLAAAVNPAAVGEVFNISHDTPLPLRFIAEEVVAAVGRGRIVSVPWPYEQAQIDIGSYFGDSSKAARVLGWRPAVGLTEGLARTVRFYREHRPCYLSST
ncbi:MAG TPA: NAD-dependent epimerase/dehydratase family protein [Acidimicrobiales bacterium]|nr:NAD-dependent epimerase/dehydratase family protein [Acidimicrobiales bacterium]